MKENEFHRQPEFPTPPPEFSKPAREIEVSCDWNRTEELQKTEGPRKKRVQRKIRKTSQQHRRLRAARAAVMTLSGTAVVCTASATSGNFLPELKAWLQDTAVTLSQPAIQRPADLTLSAEEETEKPSPTPTEPPAESPVEQPSAQTEPVEEAVAESVPAEQPPTVPPAQNQPEPTPPETTPVLVPATEPPAHTHAYTGEILRQPTCGTAGEIRFTCACGASYLVELPPEGAHRFGDWVSLDENRHRHSCSVCGITEAEAHHWENGSCMECGATQSGQVSLPKESLPNISWGQLETQGKAPVLSSLGLSSWVGSDAMDFTVETVDSDGTARVMYQGQADGSRGSTVWEIALNGLEAGQTYRLRVVLYPDGGKPVYISGSTFTVSKSGE